MCQGLLKYAQRVFISAHPVCVRFFNLHFNVCCLYIGINETFERFEDDFNQSSIGRAVSTVKDSKTKNSLSIQEAYLWDFSTYHMSSVDKQLFRVSNYSEQFTFCIL